MGDVRVSIYVSVSVCVSIWTFQSVYVSAYGRFSQCTCQHMDVSVSVRVSIWTFQSVYGCLCHAHPHCPEL